MPSPSGSALVEPAPPAYIAGMSHIPNLDPNVAAQKGFRESEERLKRFWTAVSVEARDGAHVVLLDGRTPKTPAGATYALPTETLAAMVAEEWAAQGEFIAPGTMFATRLAATAIDRVSQTREAVAEEIAAYVGSDLVCYLAEYPTGLVAEQTRAWAPWRDWAARELGVQLEATQGIIHRAQTPESLTRVRDLALALDDFALSGLGLAVPLLGSAVLGLALQRGVLSGEAAFDLSRLDEAFQERQWGIDADNAERTAARRAEAVLLERWFRAL
jgi:chaperone required for assembly of F1-ATPase